LGPGFDAAEKRLVRARAADDAAADLIRAPVNNRVDNEVRGASVAIHRRRRSDRFRDVLPYRVSRREQSLQPSHTALA
jgi:hypothetical protein